MYHRNLLITSLVILLAAACGPSPATPTTMPAEPATLTAVPPTEPPPTTPPTEVPPQDATQTPTAPPASGMQQIAYIRNGHLLVTDITNGVLGGSSQYTLAGESDKVTDLVWSPSGEFVAFVAAPKGEQHVFYIYALGASTPTDLGAGSQPAWSPDSRSLAYVGGAYPDENIWLTPIESPAPRQLSFETNHAWSRPAFTPDGQALIVATADRFYMGAQGNTSFTLERMALDGSGTRTPLPGASAMEGVRLPFDLRFSPDGGRIAFSTSSHLSACAAPGAFYVSQPDGSSQQELVSPSLKESIDPARERYYVGVNYGWASTSDALLIGGGVFDCDFNSPSMGQAVAGPQMSILGLDGNERLVIPGMYWGLSMDRTGTMIAAAHFKDIQDVNPVVEIYSAQTGQIILSVGPGNSPQLQP